MASRGPAHSAPYGQACLHCFKSKCRCIARPDGDGCERCYRLQKQCRPSDSVRRRNDQKTQNSDERTAQLEGKIDGLVSLLQSIAQSSNGSSFSRQVLGQVNDSGQRQTHVQRHWIDSTLLSTISFPGTTGSPNTMSATGDGLTPASTTTALPASSGSINMENISGYNPLPDEVNIDDAYAQAHIDMFRLRMLPSFPFVYLPPDIGVRQLQGERPFFFRAIIAVTTLSTQQKMARARSIKHILAQKVIVENQSNLDLLLGLLTFIAWSHDQFLTKSGTLSRLVTLALSIAYDLRLNKPLPSDAHMLAPMAPDFKDSHEDEHNQAEQRSLEQQRAVLGCFVLSSFISSYFAQTDAMRWTPAMEVYLQVISASKECSTDRALAFQVRLQLLAQEALQMRDQLDLHSASTRIGPPMPPFVLIKSLQIQLEKLKTTLPSELPNAEALNAHMHYLDLCINEAAYPASLDTPLVQPLVATNVGDTQGSTYARIVSLWRSLEAIRSWFEIFDTLSPATLFSFPFQFFAQMARCIVVLYRLSTLDDSAWDRQAVRDKVDLLQVLDKTLEKCEIMSNAVGEQTEDGQARRFAMMLRMIRAWVGPRMIPEVPETETSRPRSSTAANSNDHMMDDGPSMMDFVDFGDDKWLEEIFGGLG